MDILEIGYIRPSLTKLIYIYSRLNPTYNLITKNHFLNFYRSWLNDCWIWLNDEFYYQSRLVTLSALWIRKCITKVLNQWPVFIMKVILKYRNPIEMISLIFMFNGLICQMKPKAIQIILQVLRSKKDRVMWTVKSVIGRY